MSKAHKGKEFLFWEYINQAVAENCKSGDCEILYSEPLKEDGGRIKRGCKWVVRAINKASADTLLLTINDVLDDPMFQKEGKRPHFIMKAVEGNNVSLSITQATKSERCFTDDVIAKIKRKLDLLSANDSSDANMYQFLGETAISSLRDSGTEQIMSVRHTASAYRLNYYHNGERHQISMGDILIFINKTRIDFQAKSHRRARGDRYDSMKPITSFGDARFYPVDAR